MYFSSQKHLERAILETIVYFDLLSYPLTTFEIWNNLPIKADYEEVRDALNNNRCVVLKNGFWYLSSPQRDGVQFLNGERAKRYRASKYKIDKARKFVSFLKLAPWIQAVYACNSLGFLNSKQESDIDLFIVARRGRIWTARFFAVLLAKFFGRPRANRAKDGICLSFFAAQGVKMEKVALKPRDIYFEHWLKNLLSLYKRPDSARKNSRLGNWMERILRWIQLQFLPERLKQLANKGSSVVLNNEFLKFHDHDRRAEIGKQFAARLAEVI